MDTKKRVIIHLLRIHSFALYFAIFAVLSIISPHNASAQAFAETLWVPVTYYDFHADLSNPEFEPKAWTDNTVDGRKRNLVASQLDAQGKPASGSAVFFSSNVRYWFRPFADSAKGDTKCPVYTEQGVVQRIDNLATDTSFINKVFHDSLPFTYVANSAGIYRYGDTAFFPVDNKGYGADAPTSRYANPRRHNYSFTMSMHREFIYRAGMKFNFRGDDDVWVFVNKKLAMDIGGIHGAIEDSFSVDGLGLTAGQSYSFDMFFAERRVTQSSILITTNMLTPERLDIGWVNKNDTTLHAGSDNQKLYAIFYDKFGSPIEVPAGSVQWNIIGKQPGDSLVKNADGDTITLTAEKAYRQITVEAVFVSPTTGETLRTRRVITIGAGSGVRLSIEDTSLINKQTAQPLSNVVLEIADAQKTVGAVIRDEFGNFVGYANSAQWSSQYDTIASVNSGSAQWIGAIKRPAVPYVSPGSTTIIVRQGSLIPDSVAVTVYSIVDRTGPFITQALLFSGALPWDPLPITPSGDTLVVTLSEPVPGSQFTNNATANAIFDLISTSLTINFAGATIINLQNTNRVTSVTILIPTNNQVRPGVDSLTIRAGKLIDTINPGNLSLRIPRAIEWGKDYSMVVRGAPIPYKIGSLFPVEPASLVVLGSQPAPTRSSMAIKVMSLDAIDVASAKLTIYDVVGNIVIDGLKGYADIAKQGSLYFFWDGKNHFGQSVGSGTYLGVSVVKVGNSNKTTKIKIGVLR